MSPDSAGRSVLHDQVIVAARPHPARTAALPFQHLRGRPAVQLHQVTLRPSPVQPGMAEVVPEPVRVHPHPQLPATSRRSIRSTARRQPATLRLQPAADLTSSPIWRARRPLVRAEDMAAFACRDAADREGRQGYPGSCAVSDAGGTPEDGFWIHLDADVFDETIMQAVDDPRLDGLAWDEVVSALSIAVGSGHAVGLQVAIYNPDIDAGGSNDRGLAATVREALTAPCRRTLARARKARLICSGAASRLSCLMGVQLGGKVIWAGSRGCGCGAGTGEQRREAVTVLPL
jgi:hypothetical protein